MAMEPLPHGFGEFSITIDDASLASLWPLPPQTPLQHLRCYQKSVEEVKKQRRLAALATAELESVKEEVKQRLAAATAELEAVTGEVGRKEQSIAALVLVLRRTAQERFDLLRHRQHLHSTTSSSRPLTAAPFPQQLAVVVKHKEKMSAAAAAAAAGELVVASNRPTLALDLRSPALFEPSIINPLDLDRRHRSAALSSVAHVMENRARAAQLELLLLAGKKPLPQQGRLVQAVMEAGPLLQNLLPPPPRLPRWRNPPPALALNDTTAISAPPSGPSSGGPMLASF